MNYIILDLELNSKVYKSKLPNEIIEIGAVKLNNGLEKLGTFQSFVKPKIHKKLFPLIKRKTGISQTDINSADSFKNVLGHFKAWIGKEEYILCSWGHDDIHHLITNCKLNRTDSNWLEPNFDIQKNFSKIYEAPPGQRYSLKKALLLLDIALEGNLHRADIDAMYTSMVFVKVFDSLDLKIPQIHNRC